MKELRSCVLKQVNIADSELKDIEGHFKKQNFAPNEFLLRAGNSCSYLFFIKQGYLRLFTYANGREVTLWIGGEGQFITALSSFVFQTSNSWNIQAETDTEVEVIHREHHFELGKKYPQWLHFDNILLARSYELLEQSMFAHLHTSARERYETIMRDHPAMFNHVPLQHIASMLRMTPETLSRLRHPAKESS